MKRFGDFGEENEGVVELSDKCGESSGFEGKKERESNVSKEEGGGVLGGSQRRSTRFGDSTRATSSIVPLGSHDRGIRKGKERW